MSLPKSIKIGYAVFFDHIHTPELLRAHSAQLFDWIAEGKLKVWIGGEYRLADVAKAHADMESRRTAGRAAARPVGAGPAPTSAGRAVSAGPQPRVSPANVVFSRSKIPI
jgi:NADPH2:quinone reductase